MHIEGKKRNKCKSISLESHHASLKSHYEVSLVLHICPCLQCRFDLRKEERKNGQHSPSFTSASLMISVSVIQ